MTRLRKFILTISSTVPLFFSIGLLGIAKYSGDYFDAWKHLCTRCELPTTFLWWYINIIIIVTVLMILGIGISLRKQSKLIHERTTIKAKSYKTLNQIGTDQIISSLVPWLTLTTEKVDYIILIICVALQCTLITIASYNNSNYNLIYSLLGYRYYEVQTEENTYILITRKSIKNKDEITKFVELTDYIGIMI